MKQRNPKLQEKLSHDRSVKAYPKIDFAANEYVVIDVKRSKVGLVYIWLAVIFAVVVFIVLSQLAIQRMDNTQANLLIVVIAYLASFAMIGFGLLESTIYRNNHLIVTNQRVFARIQNSPFAYRLQNVELENIEDVSFKQHGILPTILNYGTIRMSTVGDEHTYEFTFSDEPEKQTRIISRVVNEAD